MAIFWRYTTCSETMFRNTQIQGDTSPVGHHCAEVEIDSFVRCAEWLDWKWSGSCDSLHVLVYFFRKLTVNCNNGNMLILIILWDTLWDNIWDHWHFYKHLVFVASDWCQRFHFTHPLPDHTRYAHPETMKSTSTSPFFPIINHTRSSRCVFHIFSPEKKPWDFHRNSHRALETGLFATGQCPRSHPWRSGDGEMKGRSESDLENFWRMPGK